MTILTPWADVISAATAYLSDIDPIMANAIVRVGPCTLTPNPNLFETLVDAIISQQISVKAADAIMLRLRAAIHAEQNGLILTAVLAVLDAGAWRAVGLSSQKRLSIRELVGDVARRQLKR